ncbi:MAG TPA: PLD nuclease N-terminal domain-containing protein [Aggregatilineaceae bacterium]|nr:PLD nuclease N-terminal domain-containing protein [Aggregatilineaceae bacterium]
MDTTTWILILTPLILIQLGLMAFALYDLYKRGSARPPLPTWAWVLIIVFGEMLGPVLYFVLGRKED